MWSQKISKAALTGRLLPRTGMWLLHSLCVGPQKGEQCHDPFVSFPSYPWGFGTAGDAELAQPHCARRKAAHKKIHHLHTLFWLLRIQIEAGNDLACWSSLSTSVSVSRSTCGPCALWSKQNCVCVTALVMGCTVKTEQMGSEQWERKLIPCLYQIIFHSSPWEEQREREGEGRGCCKNMFQLLFEEVTVNVPL